MTPQTVNLTSKMADSSGNMSTSATIELRHGYYVMFSSMLFFQTLNLIISRLGTPKSVREEPWRWRNLFISWTHAFFCAIWDILCLVLYPELFDDLILHINYFTYLMIPFSTGYFLYDSIDMLLNRKLRQNWEVTVHHVAVASMFWFNFHKQICTGYNVLALMAEINSFFLHSRKLLQMSQVDYNSILYRIVVVLNLLTFAGCRGYSVARIEIGMVMENHRVPGFYFACLSLSMFCMTVINIVLFWRLVKSDVLRGITHAPSKPINASNMNGDHSLSHVKKD